ncbi:pyroglutamyl-peptidase 1 isoform X2 [Syngnathoides biaculeatus]|uniref:pyroglutamyl-peptidase 1 isoform X2 n=1 Tax=Syngnathoides biaculeatus TaxID=300417 RepID=UPI002ADE2B2D|nr:pyroglutamyl-peptidase 1 isoform X2 [Syngnathoides biaculeatus]
MANNKKVIVTGFEPFGEHAVNSSWVAVQELERLGLGEAVDLYVCEVPVEYQAVQSLLPSLWERHLPQLVVHVGVSGLATTVTLEQCGHNKGYKRPDNCRFCPASQCCMEDGPDCISSLLDMDTIPVRLHLLLISIPGSRALCLHPRASAGETLQQPGAGSSPSGCRPGDADAPGGGES